MRISGISNTSCCVRGLLFDAVLCAVVVLPGSTVWADLECGGFGSGWETVWDTWGNTAVQGEVAVFGQPSPSGWDYLEQIFTIPAGSIGLSFEYRSQFMGEESFSASLLDPVTGAPLVPTYNQFPPDDLADSMFFMDDWYAGQVPNSSRAAVMPFSSEGWSKVTLDLTSLTFPNDALLAFDFISYGEGTVSLDNVEVFVPAPPAVALFVLGMATAGTMLRRRIGRTS